MKFGTGAPARGAVTNDTISGMWSVAHIRSGDGQQRFNAPAGTSGFESDRAGEPASGRSGLQGLRFADNLSSVAKLLARLWPANWLPDPRTVVPPRPKALPTRRATVQVRRKRALADARQVARESGTSFARETKQAQRALLLDPIRSMLRAEGIELAREPGNSMVQEAMRELLWPLPGNALSRANLERQDWLAREVLDVLGWQAVGGADAALLDDRIRRQVIAMLFSRFALDAESADVFLDRALSGIAAELSAGGVAQPDLSAQTRSLALQVRLLREAELHPNLFKIDSRAFALTSVASLYEYAASTGAAAPYSGVQLATALGRSPNLTTEELAAFDELAGHLWTLAQQPLPLEAGRPDMVRAELVNRLKSAWVPASDQVSGSQVADVASAFLDLLLPGFEHVSGTDGVVLIDGSPRWCDYILAQAVLRGAPGADVAQHETETGRLALLAEQQVVDGNPAFMALYRRLALISAALRPEMLGPSVDWQALHDGDGAPTEEDRQAMLTAFVDERDARRQHAVELAASADRLRNLTEVPNRRSQAELLLREHGLDPNEELPINANSLDVSLIEQRVAQGKLTETASMLDAYLAQDVAPYREALAARLRSDANKRGERAIRLPAIDAEYGKAVKKYLDEIAGILAPFARQLIEHGNGPTDTDRQWSVDLDVPGTTDAARRQAAKDWRDGVYYARSDRDFLLKSEIRICNAALVTHIRGYGRNPVGVAVESKPHPTSILLRAQADGETRDYLLWMKDGGTTAITRFAESIEHTGLSATDVGDQTAFRLRLLERLYVLSDDERAKVEQGYTAYHQVRPESVFHHAGDRQQRDGLVAAVMQFYADRAFPQLYEVAYGVTDIQSSHRLGRQIMLSMIPFYDCVSSAVNGDRIGALRSCMFDALSLIPIAFAGAKVTSIAMKTVARAGAAVKAGGLSRSALTAKGVIGLMGKELSAARGPYFAALRQLGLALGEELLPLPAQWGVTAARMGKAWRAARSDVRGLIGSLEKTSPAAREALRRAYAPDIALSGEAGNRLLRYEGELWPVRRMHGSEVEFSVMQLREGRFVPANPATGLAAGPELVELSDGTLRAVAAVRLPFRQAADGTKQIQVTAEVYRDAEGRVQVPVIDDLGLMRLRSEPSAPLVGIDDRPYALEDGGLRRLTSGEQHDLEKRPAADAADGLDMAVDVDGRAVLSVSDGGGRRATLQDLLGPGGRYDRYAVETSELSDRFLTSVPGADGLIRYDGRQYIQIDASGRGGVTRYYRVEAGGNGSMGVVHPRQPFMHPRIPVRYDVAARRWMAQEHYGLRGGAPGRSTELFIKEGQCFRIVHDVAIEVDPSWNDDVRRILTAKDWTSSSDALLTDKHYRSVYLSEFKRLSTQQQSAIRGWSYVDAGDDELAYAYGPQGDEYGGVNYDLNQALRGERRLDSQMQRAYENLRTGLPRLPPNVGALRLLRVADVPADYLRRISIGDTVTNAPTFMAASSANDFALTAIAEGTANPGGALSDQPDAMLAFYAIEGRPVSAARPLLPGVTTQAPEEHEWLFPPDTLFRVESISHAKLLDVESIQKPRLVVRLKEMPSIAEADAVKNLHTGELATVYPQSRAMNVWARAGYFRVVKAMEGDRVIDLAVRDVGLKPTLSPAWMDRILQNTHWKGRPAGELAPQYRESVQTAMLRMPADERQMLEVWAETGHSPLERRGVLQEEIERNERLAEAALGKLPAPDTSTRLLYVGTEGLDERRLSMFESRIRVGDSVTERGFLSAMNTNAFVRDAIACPDTQALMLLEIESVSARPLLDGGGVHASNYWGLPPNRVFRVEGVAIGEPVVEGAAKRVAVRLKEVDLAPMTGDVKDLRLGEMLDDAESEDADMDVL